MASRIAESKRINAQYFELASSLIRRNIKKRIPVCPLGNIPPTGKRFRPHFSRGKGFAKGEIYMKKERIR
ncbi:MAG: hypothetical protein AABX50_02645 [Nanoarchaeota archaeon]